MRIAFDYSLDEAVDANTRFMRGSEVGQSTRRRSILSTGITLGGMVFIIALIRTDTVTFDSLAATALVAAALGCVAAFIHSRVYDWAIRRRVRRFVREQVGDRDVLHCEIELRPDGAWVKQPYAEMLFEWADAVAVADAGDAIELHFRMGFVLARNRAFITLADRERFLTRARTLASL